MASEQEMFQEVTKLKSKHSVAQEIPSSFTLSLSQNQTKVTSKRSHGTYQEGVVNNLPPLSLGQSSLLDI